MAVVLLLSVAANAQHERGSWTIQPKAGINIATMTESGDGVRVGAVLGAEMECFATDILSFTGGLLYSQQGIRAASDEARATIKMDYIHVPLMVNVYVVKGLAIKAGLQPGFLANDKVRATVDGVSAEVGLEQAYKAAGVDANVNSVDVSVPVGISYEINHIQFEFRYNWGLTKAITAEGESTKHSVFQFTVGYKFCL